MHWTELLCLVLICSLVHKDLQDYVTITLEVVELPRNVIFKLFQCLDDVEFSSSVSQPIS